MYVYVWPHVMYISSRDSSCILDFSTSTSVHMNVLPVCAPHVGYMYVHVQVTSYKLQVTSYKLQVQGAKKFVTTYYCYFLCILICTRTHVVYTCIQHFNNITTRHTTKDHVLRSTIFPMY
jgi:hypothetical protein